MCLCIMSLICYSIQDNMNENEAASAIQVIIK